MLHHLNTFSLIVGVLACGSASAQRNNRAPIGLSMKGDGTFYRPNGNIGACGNRLQNNDAICAVSVDQADEIPCGSCLMVSGPRGQTMVRVQDKCVGCKRGDVDLSEGAFRKVADPVQGRVRVQSQVVDCNTGVAQPSSNRNQIQSARVADPNFGSSGSQDGACSRDRPCAPGFCCSQFGFCGQGEAFCGAGCQGGDCLDGNQVGSSVKPNCNSANDPFNASGSQDGTCSRDRPCAPGFCCSQFGFCGQGEAFCGTGCQGGDCLRPQGQRCRRRRREVKRCKRRNNRCSRCNRRPKCNNFGGLQSNATSNGFEEGSCSRDRPCAPGFCCSQFGFCGQGEAFCGAGCQGGECVSRN